MSRAFGWTAGAGVALALTLAAAAPAAAPEYARVDLHYDGSKCWANPENVTIQWERHPNKVEWRSASGIGYHWELVWKGGDQPNYLGRNFTLRCGKSTARSTMAPGHYKRSGARWPYAVVVYSCNGNQRGEKVCEADPGIDWGPPGG